MATAIPLVFGIGGQFLGGKFLAGVGIGGHVLGAAGGTLVGGIGGMVLGSLLFPQESPSESLPKVGSYQTQTTLSGSAIPIVKGTCRVAGNIIYLGDSHSYTIVHKSGGGGGKGIFGGGGGSSVTTTETRYRRSFLIGICEGPATIGRIWRGKEEILTSECTIFDGNDNVAAGLATIIGLEFGHYKHLCCAWFEEYDLGTSDSVPMFTFEVGSDTSFRRCDVVAGGSSKIIGSKVSIVEAYNANGDYSHVICEQVGSYGAYTLLKHNINGYCYIGMAGSSAYIACRGYDGSVIWNLNKGFGPCYTQIHLGADGYIYAGYGKVGSVPYHMLEKIHPLTSTVVWGAEPAAFGDVTGVGEGFYTYNCGAISQLKAFNMLTGTTILIKQQYDLTGTPVQIGDYIFVTGNTSHLSNKKMIRAIDLLGNSYGQPIVSGTVTNKIVAVAVSGVLNKVYVYVGINSGTNHYVGLFRFVILDQSWEVGNYYVVGGYIYDITQDIDGGILIHHNRGTDQEGHTGHVTKLDGSLQFLGSLDFDNDRSGFVRGFGRGPGTVIGNATDIETLNPVDIIADIITNKRYGAGLSEDLIDEDAFVDARQECEDNGIAIALSLDNKQPLLDWIDYIQSHYFGYLRLG